MDASRSAPSISSTELEEFYAGPPAYGAETPLHSEPVYAALRGCDRAPGAPGAAGAAGDFSCCGGVDVPGVGPVHSFDCATGRGRAATIPGRPHVAGEFPESLRALVDEVRAANDAALRDLERLAFRSKHAVTDSGLRERRDGLVALLMFAARDLADANLVLVSKACGVYRCAECDCRFPALHRVGAHERLCRTGRVIELLDRLQDLPAVTGGAA